MEPEKIYYAAVILISAVSILLSPFFYVRRISSAKNRKADKKDWKIILASNILIAVILIAVWYFWLN
ncbi:Uncharacterised protein [Neisseria weaveri]|uniref:Uncharacterized protein n=1 Tax=Neisseria weaveri TaxID=28091 RepID=A0A3S4ZMX1_9NEIS|nr:hypothetical protein l13_19410 [Neisseria weaveri ATCC 51223]EGV35816.1 hypothetical protein l11_19660 [Neisseria weaveri LMG 5135]SAY50615.1 Uncharacterised protein [Neisseria weaveri]VEJ52027.1 Uncharacterised protein [Neisseria weaveri]